MGKWCPPLWGLLLSVIINILSISYIVYIRYWISLRKYEGGVIIEGVKYQCSRNGCIKEDQPSI